MKPPNYKPEIHSIHSPAIVILRTLWLHSPNLLCLAALVILLPCCQPAPSIAALPAAAASAQPSSTLVAGDEIRITFSGAPEMNAQRTIQPDGKVSLPIIGEVSAAGQTTSSLQDQLSSYYKKHLAQADVSVDLESSVASVYVSGEVLAPGKVPLLRPLTALEAVMEVGGFSKFANPRHVIVIRHENGRAQRYQLNLHDTLNGRNPRPFHLRPFDVVYVKPSVW